MKELILDLKTWRCGGFEDSGSPNKFGEGVTALSNSEGYMCCLGQFSLQLNKELTKESINLLNSPRQTNKVIEGLTHKVKKKDTEILENTELSQTAMAINDDQTITTEERIKQLKAIFLTNKFNIIVK